jgi:hypothetical protein
MPHTAQGIMGGNSLRNITGRKPRDRSTTRLDLWSMTNAELDLAGSCELDGGLRLPVGFKRSAYSTLALPPTWLTAMYPFPASTEFWPRVKNRMEESHCEREIHMSLTP